MAAVEPRTRDELLEAAHAAASYADAKLEAADDETAAFTLELRALRLTIHAAIAADEERDDARAREAFQDGYYDVEIMGHRTRVGYVTETRVAGRYFLEIRTFETIVEEGAEPEQQAVVDLVEHGEIYSGSAIFAMAKITEAQARRMATHPDIPF